MDFSSFFEVKDTKFQKLEGITFGRRTTQEHLDKVRSFEFADQDVLCTTYPKVGRYPTANAT